VVLLPRAAGPVPAAPAAAGRARWPAAHALLFVGGAAGFSFEVVVFRHFSLANTGDHAVFGTALGVFLVFWAGGAVLAQVSRCGLAAVMLLFEGTLLLSSAMLFFGPAVRLLRFAAGGPASYLVLGLFFLPALASGWLFSRVHEEAGDLPVGRLAGLYVANLAGSFVGGVLTKYAFPWLLSFTCALLPWAVVLAVCLCLLCAARRAAVAVALGGAALVAGLFALAPQRGYYRSFLAGAERLVEVKEDWATACWLTDRNFMVGNRSQLCCPEQPFYGYRLFQVAMALRLRNHADVFIAGTALGTANGAIGRLLPDSRVVNVDYSPSVRYFVSKYRDLNFHLLEQKNSTFHTADARLQLSLEPEPFDAVLEFAEHEGVPGISTIKSVEFLRMVKRKLRPGGVYVGLGQTRSFVATAQKVFRNVYKVRDYPFVIGCDRPLEELIDNRALAEWAYKDAELGRRLEDGDNALVAVKVPPLAGRIVRDTDPCADYRELFEPVDDRGGEVVGLPRVADGP
jgi:spermidine synthase